MIGLMRTIHTANIECNVDNPSGECNRNWKPLSLPDGETVVVKLSDSPLAIKKRGGALTCVAGSVPMQTQMPNMQRAG